MTPDERREEFQDRFNSTAIYLEEAQRDVMFSATTCCQPSLDIADRLTIFVSEECVDEQGEFSEESLLILRFLVDGDWHHARIRIGDLTPTVQATVLPALQGEFDLLKDRLALIKMNLNSEELEQMKRRAYDRRSAVLEARVGFKVFVDTFYCGKNSIAETDMVLMTSHDIPEEATLLPVDELAGEVVSSLISLLK